MRLINKDEKKPAYFDLSGYVEKNLDTDPHSEVSLANNGKVQFETDYYTVNF
ncbi:MAG: hypothetical protein DHS20C13_30630 [Thermodesulfobacteriota bacterium]|nr:MAG: hypothetical protein DHS20C13_30630 [Thermodesulfobacteriota bacterium]